jgi:hypothetical protein
MQRGDGTKADLLLNLAGTASAGAPVQLVLQAGPRQAP